MSMPQVDDVYQTYLQEAERERMQQRAELARRYGALGAVPPVPPCSEAGFVPVGIPTGLDSIGHGPIVGSCACAVHSPESYPSLSYADEWDWEEREVRLSPNDSAIILRRVPRKQPTPNGEST